MTSILTLERRSYDARIDKEEPLRLHAQTDFIVDGVALSERFGFESLRPFFGQTCFELPLEYLGARVLGLRGLERARSQLGEGRFVLYGCHCGSDYCGVISCVIVREGDEVVWVDVRHEEDGDEGEEGVPDEPMYRLRLEELRFDAVRYDEEVARHTSRVLGGEKA